MAILCVAKNKGVNIMNKQNDFVMYHRNPHSLEDKVFIAAVDKVIALYNPNNYFNIDNFFEAFIDIAAKNPTDKTLQSTCKNLVETFGILKCATEYTKKDSKKTVDSLHTEYGKRVMDLLCLLSDDKEYKMFKALWPWLPEEISNRLLQKLAYNPNATLYDMSSALGAGLPIDSNTVGLIKIIATRDYNKANKDADEIKHGLSWVMEHVEKSDWYRAKPNANLVSKLLGINVEATPKCDHWTLQQERVARATNNIADTIKRQQGR